MVPLIFVPIIVEQFEMPKLYVLWIATAALLGCVSFKGLKSDPIGIGLLAFLGSTILSSIISMSPRISWLGNPVSPNGVMSTLGYVALYFVSKRLIKSDHGIAACLVTLLFSVIFACAYAMAQYLGFDFIHWTGELSIFTTYRPASTMGHPNFLAALVVMIFPAAFMILNKKVRISVCALFALTLMLTQSRGAWIAFGVITLLWLWFNGIKRHLLAWLCVLCAVFPLISGFIANNVINRDAWPLVWSLFDRLSSVYDFRGARAEYLKSSWRIFRAHPLFGTGTDTFQLAFEHGRTAAYWKMEPGGAPHRAHNEVMNIAATQGVFGIVALLILLVGIKLAIDRVPRGTMKDTLVLMIAAFLVTSFFGFPVAATSMVFVVSLASITRLGVDNVA